MGDCLSSYFTAASCPISLEFDGGLAGARTRDQRIKSPVLYQLSYQPVGQKPKTVIMNLFLSLVKAKPGLNAYSRRELII